MTACAGIGPERAERMQALPRVLTHMDRHGILPRAETCERLVAACFATKQLLTARQVLQLAKRAGHEVDPGTLEQVETIQMPETARQRGGENICNWAESDATARGEGERACYRGGLDRP